MPRRPRSDDYVEDVNIALPGAASTADDSRLADVLLDVTLQLHRLSILLSEASADDWRELRPRIVALRAAYKSVPAKSPVKRKVGFG